MDLLLSFRSGSSSAGEYCKPSGDCSTDIRKVRDTRYELHTQRAFSFPLDRGPFCWIGRLSEVQTTDCVWEHQSRNSYFSAISASSTGDSTVRFPAITFAAVAVCICHRRFDMASRGAAFDLLLLHWSRYASCADARYENAATRGTRRHTDILIQVFTKSQRLSATSLQLTYTYDDKSGGPSSPLTHK